MPPREVLVGSVPIGGKNPLALIAGPCVIEGEEHLLGIAESLQEICGKLEIPLVLKSS
ncbi:MAG: 3-deoxy-8-phosphooctulonate synthase, partial [candidate division NC10 bacterium]